MPRVTSRKRVTPDRGSIAVPVERSHASRPVHCALHQHRDRHGNRRGLVLWRYKVGVLAGMNTGGRVELPDTTARLVERRSPGPWPAAEVLVWERQVRRRVGVGAC